MASNLQKAGHELVVHDIKRDAAAPHIGAGATWADTPRQLAERPSGAHLAPRPTRDGVGRARREWLLSGMIKGKVYFD